ncbi:MAG: MHYT domain-containing protein [Wenzhouxiangellaceae bacterium]
MEAVQGSFNLFLVFLSYIISVFGAYTALVFARESLKVSPQERFAWILWAAVILGGVGIWAMHFVGMMAYDMGMPVRYDIWLTILSMVFAVIGCAVGFGIVGLGSRNLLVILIAGVFMGGGVAAMHYTGMMAMNMGVEVHWNYTIVAISIGIAVFASVAALWMAFNLHAQWQMAVAALVAGLAVSGMHYTGMFAFTYTMTHSNDVTLPSALSPVVVGGGLFMLSLIVLLIGTAFTRARPMTQVEVAST